MPAWQQRSAKGVRLQRLLTYTDSSGQTRRWDSLQISIISQLVPQVKAGVEMGSHDMQQARVTFFAAYISFCVTPRVHRLAESDWWRYTAAVC